VILGHQVCSSFRRAATRFWALYSTSWSGSDSSRQMMRARAIDDFPDCLGTDTSTSR
jgi:hypothetical protein